MRYSIHGLCRRSAPRPGVPCFVRAGMALIIAAAGTLIWLAVAGWSPAWAAPPQPHPTEGREDCLLCHAAGKQGIGVPASHAGYSREICAGCHTVAANAAAADADTSRPATTESGTTAASTLTGDSLCQSCHANQGLGMPLGGQTLSLFVDQAALDQSVHGHRLACTDCHANIKSYPHASVPYADRRALSVAYYEACKRCHFANYTKTLDSVHFASLSAGERNAPLCTDCHGAHAVVKAGAPRSSISRACGQCHTAINNEYAGSVHGRALEGEENADVPVCTTCHGVHSIRVAASASFRLASTNLCARCHEDKQLMAKYGLSAGVLKTYFEDFHGRTVGFHQQQDAAARVSEPLCIDCHGIHSIKSTKDPSSPVVRANLQATCQKCHADASPNFPAAWLGHYEPSAEKASLVYYIRLYYWILIPVMIGGLVMHIGLDLWRLARNR